MQPLLPPPSTSGLGTRPAGRLRCLFLCLGTPLPPWPREEGRVELGMVGEGLSLEIHSVTLAGRVEIWELWPPPGQHFLLPFGKS